MEHLPDLEFLKTFMGLLATISFFTFVLSLIIIPWLVGKLSPDCFFKFSQQAPIQYSFTPYFLAYIVLRNIAGIVMLLAGIAMLFLPGQGILTILLGIFLLSFPGKRRFLLALISRPGIQRSLNWIRTKRSKPPFIWPHD